MVNKKGVSSIVVTSFIVLGTLIGAVLLWAFVLRATDRSNEVINPDCLTVNLDVVGCSAYGLCNYYGGVGGYAANVLVKRKAGAGNVTGIRFIFEDINNVKKVYDKDLNTTRPLNELESVPFTEPFAAIPVPSGTPRTLRVAALIGKDREVCPITSRTESCGIINEPPPLGNLSNTTYTGGIWTPNPRAGYCCQFPHNTSECYIGGDPLYPLNAQGQLPQGVGVPPGNISLCCRLNPYTGQQTNGTS